jgi:hypothetical protein
MSQSYELARVKNSLASEALSLDDIWLSQPSLWQELGWSPSQLHLWLSCLPEVEVKNSGDSAVFSLRTQIGEKQTDLSEEIAKVLQATGKPMPLAQLKNKLPAGLLATEPMLKTAIKQHPNLALTGPLVKLIK